MTWIESELLKAELMASAPEFVHTWLKARAELPSDESLALHHSDELELTLLTRNSDLIGLGIARYGFSEAAVRQIFQSASTTDQGRLLRMAALSNRKLGRSFGLVEPMPHRLFSEGYPDNYPNETALRKFILAASEDEIEALFQNATINEDLLTNLFSQGGVFADLEEQRWMRLMGATKGNTRLKTDYSGPLDGFAEYRHGKVFDAAWALTVRVPTTEAWARFLGVFLEEITPRAFSIKDIEVVLSRWREEPEDEKREASALNPFFYLRLLLTQLIHETTLSGLKGHKDITIRCAFYRRCGMTLQAMQEAHTAEPQVFLDHAVYNEFVWRDCEKRDLLRKFCWAAKEPDELWHANSYQKRDRYLRDKHPDWFSEVTPVMEKEASLADVTALVRALQVTQREQGAMLKCVFASCLALLCALFLYFFVHGPRAGD